MYLLPEDKTSGPAIREMDQVSKRLLAAAAIIREYGHCKGSFRSGKGAACAVGAIMAVDYDTWDETQERLRAYLGVDSVPRWNDEDKRTKEQVITALEQCALHARSSGGK